MIRRFSELLSTQGSEKSQFMSSADLGATNELTPSCKSWSGISWMGYVTYLKTR